MTDVQREIPILEEGSGNIPLFLPNIPKSALKRVEEVLNSRWIGQGPKVAEFESSFKNRFLGDFAAISVGSGTDALHLSYLLAGIESGDEVLTPAFTCTATNIPLLYIGAKPVLVDVDPHTLNIDIEDLRRKISKKTKAIVVVHYGGLPCEMDEITELAESFGIPVIEDAAHALGAKYKGKFIGQISDFTMYSFQAIKHITTGDGGLLAIKNFDLVEKSKRLRWFGIDRSAKQLGVWENDITEVGYKYQMTDLGAAVGLAGLDEFDVMIAHRRALLNQYISNLNGLKEIKLVGIPNSYSEHAAWLFTILATRRRDLQKFLYVNGVESNQVHYRNDRYSILGGRRDDLPNMDKIEESYLVLPLHTRMELGDVDRVSNLIFEFYSKLN